MNRDQYSQKRRWMSTTASNDERIVVREAPARAPLDGTPRPVPSAAADASAAGARDAGCDAPGANAAGR